MVTKLDRLARSLPDARAIAVELTSERLEPIKTSERNAGYLRPRTTTWRRRG